MKRKFLLFALVTFLTFGLAGCDILLSLLGQVTTTVTTVETTDTSDTAITTVTTQPAITTTEGTTTAPVTTTTGGTTVSTIQQYTVVFYDYDGTTVLKTQMVTQGGSATPPADPARPATDQFTFAFSGWSGSYTNVTANATVLATYTATIRQYTVTFLNDDGTTVLGTSTVDYGTAATAPANPSKPATAQYTYAFTGWSAVFNDVRSNFSVTAQYGATVRQYTVTFVNYDGAVLGTSTVNYGTAATAPAATPDKPDTPQWDYAFIGWDVAFANVQSTLTVTAQFGQTLRQYEVRFVNDDDSLIQTSMVAYGSGATAPANPTKASTAQFDYAFTNWDVPFASITGALTVRAVYASTVRSYEVVFQDADGTELKTETVAYGGAATAPADPSRDSTAQYDYAFTGWDVAFDPIHGETTVTATYSQTVREYSVIFYDEDGITVLDEVMVPYGGSAIPPADPAKAGNDHATYTFSHWEGTYVGITGHETVIAVYDEQRTAYFVSFFDIDGALIDRQLVLSGQDAVAPADPARPDTTQYTYTFTGWLGDYLAVSADVAIYAQYDVVVNTYTVAFYSEDGLTLLGTSTVEYGHPAVAPDDPTKPEYFFVGWSEGVAFVTRDMVVFAVFSDVVWDRQLLLDYVATWHEETPTPEQLEADVAMLLGILGLDPLDPLAERQAYDLVMVFQGFLADMTDAGTLAEIQEAYANAKASGFDRDRVITVLLGVAEMNIENGIANGRVEEILSQIAWLEQAILDAEAGKPIRIQDGVDYCTGYAGENQAACASAWAAFVEETNLNHAYIELIDQYTYELYQGIWNWDVWYDLSWLLEDILHYTYVEPDPYYVDLYLAAYNEVLNGLSSEDQAMYDAVLTAFSAWKSFQMTTADPYRELAYGLADVNGYNIGGTLTGDLLASYEQLFWDINQYSWHIVELQWQLQDAYDQREVLLALQAYLATEEGYAKAEILVGTVYDMLESVLYGIDEGTFELLFGLATGQIDPATLSIDPASLLNYVDRSAALIRLFLSTVDAADLANVKSILIDALGIYADVEGLSAEETTALVALFSGRFDEYALMVEDVYGEFLAILDSLDEAKIQIIVDQIQILQNGVYGIARTGGIEGIDLRQIVAIAKIVDILAYQSGVDVEALAGYFVRLYYDMNYEFCYDDMERLAVTAALQDSVARILELVHVIAGFESGVMPSPAQLEMIFELKVRIETIGQAFGEGWPELMLEADYTTYTHEMFLDLIYQMNGWSITPEEAEAQIAMIVATLEESEQDSFFIMLAFASVFQNIGRNPSVTVLADFYFGLAAMGYDNATLARIITNFAVNMVDYQIAYSDVDDRIAQLEEMIAEYMLYIDDLDDEYALVLAAVSFEIALLPEDARAVADACFQSRLQEDLMWREYWRIYDNIRYSDAYYDLWNDFIYDNLTDAIDRMSQYGSTSYEDPIAYDEAQDDFDSVWDSLTDDERNMYLPALNAWKLRVEFYWNTVEPAIIDLTSWVPGLYASDGYTPFFDYLMGQLDTLYWNRMEVRYSEEYITNWTSEMTYLQEHGLDELYAFQTFLADPLNRALIEDAVLIVLDDFAGVLAATDTETIDMFLSFFVNQYGSEMPDLSAAAILGYTQDLSAILKALGATITEDEYETLITLAMKGFAFFIGAQSEIPETEMAAILDMIEGMIRKYLPIAIDTRDIVTDFLDSLTVEKIQIVLDQLAILGFGDKPMADGGYDGPSQIEMAIAIATIVDTLLYDGSLDTDALIATAIEIYYDVAVGGGYDPAVKAAVVVAFQTHVDQLIMMAHDLAGVDPSILTPADVALLMELQQRLDFLMGVLQSGDLERILEPVTFGYQRWMFVELLWNLDWSGPWDDETVVDVTITTVTQVFETSEEESYYNLVAIMNLVRGAIESQDPEMILNAIAMLEQIGFTDEEIAGYLGNLPLAVLTYQQFISDYYYYDDGNPYAWDLQYALANLADLQAAYEMDLLYAQENVDYWIEQLARVLNVGVVTIPLISDETTRDATLAYWNQKIANDEAGLLYYWSMDEAEMNPAWNYDLFYDLQYDLEQSIYYASYQASLDGFADAMTASGYRADYDDAFAALTPEEQAMYGPILALDEAFLTENLNGFAQTRETFYDAFWSATVEDEMLMNDIDAALSEHWYILDSLHDAQKWVDELDAMYLAQIQEAADFLAEIQALYDSYEPEDLGWLIDFFADPANDALWNTITLMIVQEIDNLLENVTPEMLATIESLVRFQQMQGEADSLRWQIEDLYWQLNDYADQASEAIAELSDPISIAYAQTWWDVNVASTELWVVYQAKTEAAWEVPGYDDWFYRGLESYIDSALYEEIVGMNPGEGMYFRGQADMMLAGIDPAMVPIYMDLLSSFEMYRSHYYAVVRPAEIDYFGHMGTGVDYTMQLGWAIENLNVAQNQLNDTVADGALYVSMILDEGARNAALEHWNWTKAESEAYVAYIAALEIADDDPLWNEDMFYNYLLYPLSQSIYYNSYLAGSYGSSDPMLAGSFYTTYVNTLSSLTYEEQTLYLSVLEPYQVYGNLDCNQQPSAQDLFWTAYGTATVDDQSYMILVNDVTYTIEPALFSIHYCQLEVEYWQSMVDATTGEISWSYYYIDSLVWSYRYAMEQVRWMENQKAELEAGLAGLVDLSPAGLVGYAQILSGYLGIVGDSIDEIEAQALADFMYALTAAHIHESGLYTTDEEIILMAEIEGVFEWYVDGILYAPDMLATFLANVTEEEIVRFMDALQVVQMLGGDESDLANMTRAVAIADMVLAVAGDGNLDVDFIVESFVCGFFDGEYHLHYDGPIDIEARILYLQTLIGDILLQADVIDEFDPNALTEEQRGEINAFHLLVEELIPYFDYGPDYEPIV
ncbi:MAG: InlB B-repeat-containing protein [Candidatus Izemoplasmatales bacterium]